MAPAPVALLVCPMLTTARGSVVSVISALVLEGCSSKERSLPPDAAPTHADATLGLNPLPDADRRLDAPDAEASVPRQLDATADADAPCWETPVPLVVWRADAGYASRLFANVTYRNNRGIFLLDFGSGLTFLSLEAGSPDPVYDAGTVEIGACDLTLLGRPYSDDENVDGSLPIGTLGTDAFLTTPTELDLVSGRVVRYPIGQLPSGASTWPEVPFDVYEGGIIVAVTLNGTAVRLLVDTGSPHTAWVGQPPEPGDVPYPSEDASGALITFYLGTATLALTPTDTQSIPILRIQSWPYFQQSEMVIGGDYQGLLGLSALGNRRIIVDPQASVFRFGPIAP